MIGDPSNLVTVNWSVIRDATDAYVLEFTDGQLSLTYGPMPASVAGQFILRRKEQVAAIFDRIIRRIDDGKDQTHETEPLPGASLS